MSLFSIRPSNTEKDPFRIRLTAASLLSLKVKPGDIVQIRSSNDDESPPRPAIVWENSGAGMKDTVVQISKFLQELYGLKLSDKISITRSTDTLKDAELVLVQNISTSIMSEELVAWQYILSAVLPTKYDVLAPGQRVSEEVGNKRKEFEIKDVGGVLGRVTADTKFVLTGQSNVNVRDTAARSTLNFDRVGGLLQEIKQVKAQVDDLFDAWQISEKHWSGFTAEHGLLLYGSKGTGKTLFLETLAQSSWNSVVRWTPGTKLPTAVFPRLIIADLTELTGPHKGVAELLTIFKEAQLTTTLIVGETRHPNDLNEKLRGEQAFSFELELPVPDSDKRLDILRTLRRESSQPSDEQIRELATRTHGFVGADLVVLLRNIWKSARRRAVSSSTTKPNNTNADSFSHYIMNGNTVQNHANLHVMNPVDDQNQAQPDDLEITITQSDIDFSLSRARPSALQEVFLEKPNVRWTDIGGQHALKHRLTTAVNRTLSPTLRARMAKLGVEVTKGVLLYGPPGCSKTLLAKALATEAGLNFLAVKGAELISMYVGESERATREVFRKARVAAPSILFFDEIDAIASRGSSSSHSSSNNLNVLTTLLNEMDGFEELKNVIVVAATNKPQDIDPALLRPGRFDNVVYVGLPDVDTRREIMETRFRNVEVMEDVKKRWSEEFARDTEGYSGAEVVAICKAAGESAFEADRDVVTMEDIKKAIVATPRMVTQDMLGEYERWNSARSAQG